MKNTIILILTSFYFFITFYLVGAIMIENEVNYRTWLYVGSVDFPAFHQAFDRLLTPFFKVPLTIGLLVSIALIFFTNDKIKRVLFTVSTIVLLYFLIISLTIQVPLHEELNVTHNTATINKLIENNSLYRLPSVILYILTNVVLLFLTLKKTS